MGKMAKKNLQPCARSDEVPSSLSHGFGNRTAALDPRLARWTITAPPRSAVTQSDYASSVPQNGIVPRFDGDCAAFFGRQSQAASTTGEDQPGYSRLQHRLYCIQSTFSTSALAHVPIDI